MKTVKLDLSSVTEIVKSRGLAPGGKIQRMLNDQIATSSDRFTPFMQGVLKTSPYPLPQSGLYIEYNTPYARYLWFGKLMVDPEIKKGAFFSQDYGFWSRPGVPKELTTTDLKFSGAPIRGSKWVYRAWATDGTTITSNLERLLNK